MNTVLDLIYSFFNQYLFQEAKNNISDLEYYFSTNPNTLGNTLVEMLLKSIKDYPLESIDEPLFRSILMRTGKTPAEQQQILSEIIKWKKFSKDQVEPARKMLQDVCASVIIQRANRLYQDSPSEYLKHLKSINFQTADVEVLKDVKFNQIDINSIIAESATEGGVPSRYDWINQSFSGGRYEYGQIGIICAPPGVGKSLFAMSEALNMALSGERVHYMALGDLKMKDFIIRLGAQFTGMSFSDVTRNLGAVYNAMMDAIGDRLGITILPAGQITIEEYVEFMESQPEYKVCFLDYDGNLKNTFGGESGLYLYYGHVYETLTKLSMNGRLIFSLAQPKIYSYLAPLINLPDIGESSKKQQTADFILTASKGFADGPNLNNLGAFHLCKNRRGETNVVEYFIRLNNGRFKIIPKPVWDQIKQINEKVFYTDGDIDTMVEQYNREKANIDRQIQGAYNNGGGNQGNNRQSSGPTPFNK